MAQDKPRPNTGFEVETIPQDMIDADRWVNWLAVNRDGKWTKVPIQPDGKPAKSNDPATWSTFWECVNAAKGADMGIGFMLGDGWVGVDFDRLDIDTELAGWVKGWLERHPSVYYETSPSTTGGHAILRGAKPAWAANRKGNVELYDSVRFLCVTGWAHRQYQAKIGVEEAAIYDVAARWLDEAPRTPAKASAPSGPPSAGGDASAADWALCVDLAARGFRAEEIEGRLREKMQREGRDEKAARHDYIPRTVRKALAEGGADAEGEQPLETADMAELLAAHPVQTPYLVHGLLRRGEIMGIVAPPKARKSFLVSDLALSCATGTEWHGHFGVEKGRVLLIDNELTDNELAVRSRAIMGTRGITADDVRGALYTRTLRNSDRGVDSIIRSLEKSPPFDLIIFDALYMFLEKGMDENSNADMTCLLRKFRRLAARTGCCVALVHHTAKGSQANKDPIDAGSGAGAFGRALDTLVTLYRHEEDDYFVAHYRQRSSAPRGPLGLHWRYPCFTDALHLDLDAIYVPGKRKVEE